MRRVGNSAFQLLRKCDSGEHVLYFSLRCHLFYFCVWPLSELVFLTSVILAGVGFPTRLAALDMIQPVMYRD